MTSIFLINKIPADNTDGVCHVQDILMKYMLPNENDCLPVIYIVSHSI